MNVAGAIKDAIRLGAEPIPVVLCKAIVVSVDVDNQCATIKMLESELTYSNVPLGVDFTGLLIVPSVGSLVGIAFTDQSESVLYIISYSAIDQIIVKTNTSISIQCIDVEFNGGENSGLVKVKELTQKLNVLENELTSLKARLTVFETVFNTHTHVVVAPSVPTVVPVPLTAVGNSTPLTSTVQSELENTKVKH